MDIRNYQWQINDRRIQAYSYGYDRIKKPVQIPGKIRRILALLRTYSAQLVNLTIIIQNYTDNCKLHSNLRMQNKRVRARMEVKKIRNYTSCAPTAQSAQAERFKIPRKRNKKRNLPQILEPRKMGVEFCQGRNKKSQTTSE